MYTMHLNTFSKVLFKRYNGKSVVVRGSYWSINTHRHKGFQMRHQYGNKGIVIGIDFYQ